MVVNLDRPGVISFNRPALVSLNRLKVVNITGACSKLKEIEQILEDRSFTRVHNSYIVNLNEIEKYIRGEGGYLVMSDGSSVDVSRSRKENLLKRLSSSQI